MRRPARSELDATLPEGHEGALAQLAQDAVHVDRGEPQRIGQEILVERADEAAVRAEPHELQAQPQLEQEMGRAHQRCAGRC